MLHIEYILWVRCSEFFIWFWKWYMQNSTILSKGQCVEMGFWTVVERVTRGHRHQMSSPKITTNKWNHKSTDKYLIYDPQRLTKRKLYYMDGHYRSWFVFVTNSQHSNIGCDSKLPQHITTYAIFAAQQTSANVPCRGHEMVHTVC